MEQDFSQGFDINDIISDVARNYIIKAMKESGNNKTKAAELLGLNNGTTLQNWIKKYN